MKVWKLTSGILSIVLSVFIAWQSMFAGLSNMLEANEEVGGSAGIFVAILFLAGGICSIAMKSKNGKGCVITLAILFGLGSFLGYTLAGSYTDLRIWATWGLACAVIPIIDKVVKKISNRN